MLELRWLVELRMRRYMLAAGTLGRVARAQGGDVSTFQAAQRAACLAKLALLADQEGGLASVRPKVCHLHLVYLDGMRKEHMRSIILC